jgi:hypothetical protein
MRLPFSFFDVGYRLFIPGDYNNELCFERLQDQSASTF